MRNVLKAMLVCSALLLPSAVEASPIEVGDKVWFSDGPGTTSGGEFLLTADSADSFLTFCLQKGEYIDFTIQFVVSGISEYAYADSRADGGDGTGRDYLSSQTAWLYTQFRAGTLQGYDYRGSNRTGSANDLQNAIWWFENEIDSNPGNNFVVLANNALLNGWSGLGDVRVLNLTLDGREAQDQLALVSTPEPASLTLLGSGLALAAWRRRRARQA